jgi:subtilisin family serine protease
MNSQPLAPDDSRWGTSCSKAERDMVENFCLGVQKRTTSLGILALTTEYLKCTASFLGCLGESVGVFSAVLDTWGVGSSDDSSRGCVAIVPADVDVFDAGGFPCGTFDMSLGGTSAGVDILGVGSSDAFSEDCLAIVSADADEFVAGGVGTFPLGAFDMSLGGGSLLLGTPVGVDILGVGSSDAFAGDCDAVVPADVDVFVAAGCGTFSRGTFDMSLGGGFLLLGTFSDKVVVGLFSSSTVGA